MKQPIQKVRYEFYSYSASGNTQAITLVLNDPLSVRFVMKGTSGLCIINKVYLIQGCGAVFQGLPIAENPFELILNNNINEIDVTNYQILLDGVTLGDATLNVICKYAVNDLK